MTNRNRPPLLPLCICLAWIIALAGCSTFKNDDETVADTSTTEPILPPEATQSIESGAQAGDHGNLWEEIADGYGLPEVNDSKVNKNLRWLSNNQRYLDKVTAQSKPYLYYVASQLRENDLPLELALLPIVESAYNPFASSPSKAVGF